MMLKCFHKITLRQKELRLTMSHPPLEQHVQELEKKIIILAQLAEISAALNSQLDLDSLLTYIMEVACQITGCDAASILLWDKKNKELVFTASTTGKSASTLIGKPVPVDSIAGTILLKNEIIQLNDARSDPRHYSRVDEEIKFETRSLLGVPMSYKDRLIGVLEAINKHQLPWSDDDRNYLSILAAQAAVAIEGAQLVAELKKANEELNELDKLKNNFIAIASHELRTPLGVVMGYASFLQMEESQSAQDNAAKVMESALKLRKIIDDMINLRYLKQKQSDLYLEKTSIGMLFQHFQRDTLTLLDNGKHNIEIRLPQPDIPIIADVTRMVMALTNMLNNAIAFTPPNGDITLKGYSDGYYAFIEMTDTGIGIPADKLDKIFEEFYQIEDHMTRRHGGLGIGLSIARAIIEAHDGTIVTTSPGIEKGTTFTIRLPMSKPETPVDRA